MRLKWFKKTRFHRRITQTVPCRIALAQAEGGWNFTIHGIKDDVRHAVALLREHIGQKYRAGFYLAERDIFDKIKESWRDPTTLRRIEKTSGVQLELDDEQSAILFTGSQSSVRKAKSEALKFLDFVLGPTFLRLDHVPAPLLLSLANSGAIAEAAATAGVQIVLDRDVNSVLIFSSDGAKALKANEVLDSRMEGERKLFHIIQLERSEDWIISTILGKNGNRIKSLRKETACKIDVASQERRVTISGDSEDVVVKAQATLEQIITQARKECVLVGIPSHDMAAFVGKSGSNIKEFSATHNVQVQIMKKGESAIRITGKEEAVAAATGALAEWSSTREERRREEQAAETITLRNRDEVLSVIGPKGSIIRGLQRQFGCQIDVDRQSRVVTVKGINRAQAIERIRKILNEDDAEQLELHDKAAAVKPPKIEGVTTATIGTKTTPEEKSKAKLSNEETVKEKQDVPIQVSDFPALSDETNSGTTSAIQSSSGPSWASLTKANVPMELQVPDDDIAQPYGKEESNLGGLPESEDKQKNEDDNSKNNNVTDHKEVNKEPEQTTFMRMVSDEAWDATSVASKEDADELMNPN